MFLSYVTEGDSRHLLHTFLSFSAFLFVKNPVNPENPVRAYLFSGADHNIKMSSKIFQLNRHLNFKHKVLHVYGHFLHSSLFCLNNNKPLFIISLRGKV